MNADTDLHFDPDSLRDRSDPDSLRDRYRRERDRRVRADGSDQYVEMEGEFARFKEDDPYVEPGFTRPALNDQIDVAIIGGGFSGLLAAARLTEQGVTSFRIIEAGGDFGGTWYWNRYPGAQCDTESYLYLPLLDELNYMPKEKYSYVSEIFEHTQRIGSHYGLYDKTYFQTRVRWLDWDDEIDRWHIHTNRDDDFQAQFVIMAVGPMTSAKLPGIPGIADFKGHSFHTSRWDYAYTGGDTTGGMTKLEDKRVAIIGTGATGVQCVPRVGQYAEHLYVFQRTHQRWIGVEINRRTPTGGSRLSRDGNASAATTSTTSRPAAPSKSIWSTMVGQISSERFPHQREKIVRAQKRSAIERSSYRTTQRWRSCAPELHQRLSIRLLQNP